MPIHWKIITRNFLLNIFFFTFFFVSISIFFKLSRLTRYFVSGIDIQELLLLLKVFLCRSFPIAISITTFISAFIVVTNLKKNKEITAFSSLGLNPLNLLTPILFLSTFLSVTNLAIHFIFSPIVINDLKTVLHEKKTKTSILGSFSRKCKKKDRYITITTNKDPHVGKNFLFVETKSFFSFLLSPEIKEKETNLILTNPSYFRVEEEKKGFNSIYLSQNTSTILPKNSILSIFPYASINIGNEKLTKEKIISIVLGSFYPLIFSLLSITIALKAFPIFPYFICGYTLILFMISIINLSYFLNLLTFLSFIAIFGIFTLSIKKLKQGIK